MDAGWVDTYDQLYHERATGIFGSVFKLISERKDLTFTIGDHYFFRRWYENELNAK